MMGNAEILLEVVMRDLVKSARTLKMACLATNRSSLGSSYRLTRVQQRKYLSGRAARFLGLERRLGQGTSLLRAG
jgi:hypothetical protein